jgi:hypothetical protein
MKTKSPGCPSCKEPFNEELKNSFATRYEFVFSESRSPASILMAVDCANSGLTIKSYKTAGFCPKIHEQDCGGYVIRRWWVTINGKLEEWTIGPGGFFRVAAKNCDGCP